MQKIFISCSSKDSNAALTICDAIEARGYECWISSRDIDPGENFQEAIVKAIRRAPLMILVFSANANNSSEIKKEIALASQNRVTVIPVRIEDTVPSDALAYEFSTRQWIDVFGDWERAMKQLLAHIARALPQEAAATDAAAVAPRPAAPPAKGKSQFARLPYVIASLAIAALAIGWLAWPTPIIACQNCVAIRLVDDQVAKEAQTAPGDDWVQVAKPENGAPDHLWLKDEGKIDGNILAEARATTNQGRPVVEFTLTPKAAEQFAALTRDNIGRRFALVVNGAIVSAPVVATEISGGEGEIAGGLASTADAETLAAQMRGMP